MKFAGCYDCKFYKCDLCEYPCNDCIHSSGMIEHFDPISSGKTPEQPTTPPMPPVNPPKEEVNHPDRYNTGGVECIDVMLKIFGVDAVKFFCKLNAFKYIWREQRKNGVEDIKKAVWYLNKYIELCEDINENV